MKVRDIAYCITYPFGVAAGFILGKLIDWWLGNPLSREPGGEELPR